METRLLIRGERVEGDDAELAVENPATEETLASVGLPSAEQLDAAVVAANEAFAGWASTPAVERAELLHEVAIRLRARTDELARVMTLEGGKPLIENSDGREAVGAHAAVDAHARPLLRPSAARSAEHRRGRRRRGLGNRERRADRRRGLHGLGGDRQARGRGLCVARGADEPRDGRQGPVHRLRRRGRRRGGCRQGRRLGRLSERRAGLHLSGALLRGARGVRRLRLRFRRLHALAASG